MENVAVKEIETKSDVIISQAKALEITNESDNGLAVVFVKRIKDLKDEINNTFNPIISKAHEAHKEACKQKKIYSDPLDEAERIVNRERVRYNDEKENKRRIEEARLADIQRKEAEKIKEKAEKAEAKGNTEKAEALKQQALEVESVAPVVEKEVEPEGSSFTIKWKHEVIDINLLDKQWMIPDDKTLASIATTSKGTRKIAGVRFYTEKIPKTRR